MPAHDKAPEAHRPTLGEQLARQHELLMAQATKPARITPQSIELAEHHTGPEKGNLRIASLALVQHDGESDVQFIGRLEETTRAVLKVRDTLNAEHAAGSEDADGETE